MSDTTDTTNLIDEKKQEQNNGSSSDSLNTYASKVFGFLRTLIILIIIILLYFSSGALILFVCKLAQANILPTEANCAPYTDIKPIIQPSPIKTNIFPTFTDPEMSMKLEIPYDINSKNKLLEIFKEYKEKPSSNFLANYFIDGIENLLQFNYSMVNSIMNLFNETLPESVMVYLGPIIIGILYAIGIVVNFVYYIIFGWFGKMSWFFKTNKNDTGEGKPEWEDVTITSPINWCIGVGLAILFTILLFVAFPFVSMIPLIFYHKALLTTLFYKVIMNGKQVSSFTIVKETLKYYKISIVSIISLFVILLAFSNLGAIPGIFSILTLALIYYGVISIDIFKSIPEHNLSPSVSYQQAEKKCGPKIEKKHKKWFFGLFGGQTGGDLTKQLKKIGKTL
jgi:flagellar basal body-associated protein FliL